MDSLASQIIVDILNKEMVMPANSVWIREQNKVIPNDNKLYIAVGMTSALPLANITRMEEVTPNVVTEVNRVQQRESIQIDIFSNSNEALLRQWEVVAAMQSFYSQQQQEKYNFKIFRTPQSFIDTSSAEGGSTLKRYSITIQCMVWYRKVKPFGDYYDDFTTRVDDENTIGTNTPMVEFEINKTGIVE